MGKLHPHSDTAIYDSLVRMADKLGVSAKKGVADLNKSTSGLVLPD